MRAGTDRDDLVYFLHIPRTGGTTLRELLARRFPADRCLLAGSRRRFAEVMAALPDADKRRLRFVSAHWDTSVTRLLGRVPRFVTMLREPAERLRSHWEIVRRMPEHRLHAEVAAGMGFLEWLDHPEGGCLERDRMTRQIAGAMDGDPRRLPRGRALAELACEHLEDFACFGIREAYEDSLRLVAHAFAWPPFGPPPRLNATDGRPLAPAEREAALERNRLDAALYRFAVRRFRRRLARLAAPRRPGYAGPARVGSAHPDRRGASQAP